MRYQCFISHTGRVCPGNSAQTTISEVNDKQPDCVYSMPRAPDSLERGRDEVVFDDSICVSLVNRPTWHRTNIHLRGWSSNNQPFVAWPFLGFDFL